MKSVSCVQKTLHWPHYTGKEDFIQGYRNRGEGLSRTLLKEKVENFWVLGSTSGKLLGLCGGGWMITPSVFAMMLMEVRLLPSHRDCLLGALSFLMVIFQRDGSQGFVKDIPGL